MNSRRFMAPLQAVVRDELATQAAPVSRVVLMEIFRRWLGGAV
jgi:hypothetical protein